MNGIIKLCECGCGKPAPIAKKTNNTCGYIKDMPKRFIVGHSSKNQPKGNLAYRWKGGIIEFEKERTMVHNSLYPKSSSKNRYIFKSILVAEKVLGKPLPKKAKVHHVDENKKNDDPYNLVICENQAYHLLLHQRKRAYNACGHADWRKCLFCQKYDDSINLYMPPNGNPGYHLKCRRENYRKRKEINYANCCI